MTNHTPMETQDNNKEAAVIAQEKTDAKIDAIKEIIFGENIREIESEFDQTRKLIQEQRQNLQEQLNDVRKEMEGLIQHLTHDMYKQVNSLQEEMLTKLGQVRSASADREVLGKMLEDIGRKLQKEGE